MEIREFAVVVRVPQTAQNLVISRSYFAEDGKEMKKDLQRTCTSVVLLIKTLFGDVHVAVVVVICLSFLITQN